MIIGDTWNRLNNKYYLSPNITRAIKSEKFRWDGQAA
jgi:hypothetical protein